VRGSQCARLSRRAVAVAVIVLALAVPALAQHEVTQERRIDDVSDVPAEARLALFEAQIMREEGKTDEAVDRLLAFLEDYPEQDHFLVRFHLAASWARRGDQEEALKEYQRSVEMESLFAQGWLNLGELAYGMGKYDLAAGALATGYETSEWKEPAVLFFAAAAHVMADRSAEAVPMLEELVSGAHGEPRLDWYRTLLMAQGALEDVERGNATVDAMLAQYAEDPAAWRLAFQYFASTGDYESGAVALTVAGYLSPLTRDEKLTLGDLLLAVGTPAPAGEQYAIALADSATTSELERLSSAYLAAYDFDAALATLDRALAEEPTPRLWSLLGDLRFMRSEFDAAYGAYSSCVEADTSQARAYFMMGYCAIQLDRTDDAIASLERAARYPDQSGKANQLLLALKQLAGK